MNTKKLTAAGIWLLSCTLLAPLGVQAGSGSTLNDVWMQYGGARPQYNALTAPTQTNTGGAGRRDPASLPIMAPMKSWPAQQTAPKRTVRRAAAKKSAPAVSTQSTAATRRVSPARTSGALTPPAAQKAAPVAMPTSTPAPTVGNVQSMPALDAAPAPQTK